TEVYTVNPYASHPSLAPLEAEVLWGYLKLSTRMKEATKKLHVLAKEPDETMLARLRVLEKKMGLVLTLFQASVWGVINEQSS
ncbi:hypothetical protein FISHEDRAFT_38109, partial [Fistulina hepatica ATCC 64428]